MGISPTRDIREDLLTEMYWDIFYLVHVGILLPEINGNIPFQGYMEIYSPIDLWKYFRPGIYGYICSRDIWIISSRDIWIISSRDIRK